MSQTLNDSERVALLTLCVMAAYADGEKGESERAEVKRIIEGLDSPSINPVAIYQEALRQPQPIAEIATRLQSPAARAMAYEMAVCVCDADDVLDKRESAFLEQLRSALGLQEQAASEFRREAEAITTAPMAMVQSSSDDLSDLSIPAPGSPSDPEVDKMILNYSILTGALELLPRSLATMAIIPLQMKMVYRIGKRHGYELDRGHVRDFLATVGVGVTSQVVEGYAVELLGGLLGRFVGGNMGKLAKSIAQQAASSTFSFSSTYALGQVARQYYAGGRKFASVQLRELFSSSLSQAKSLHGRYLPQIQERVKTINPSQLLSLVQGR